MYLVTVVIASLLFFALPVDAAAPVARIEAARSDCMAPCAVFFDGRKSTDADLSRDQAITDLTYVWNFGDPESGNWESGVSHASRNIDLGFVAGHVYEKAGSYTASLRVWDGEQYSSAATQIVVREPSDVIPQDNTFCFSNDDNFSQCPISSAGHHIVTNKFADALARCGAASRPAWCLFKRGDTFRVGRATKFSRDVPRLIEAFGTGSRPLLEVAAGTKVFSMKRKGVPQDVRISDLKVEGMDAADTTFMDASRANYKKLLLLRLDIENVDSAMSAGASNKRPGSDPANDDFPDQLAIVDVKTSSRPGRGGTDYYLDATRVMILGSDIGDADGQQHNIRFRYNDGTVLAHGRYGGGCGRSHHVLKMTNRHHNIGAGCGTNPARDFLLADSIIEGCQANDIMVQFSPNSTLWFERLKNYVAERNVFRHGPNRKSSVSMLLLQGPRMVARHNIFIHDGENAVGGRSIRASVRSRGPCKDSCGQCPLRNPMSDADKPVDVQIYNNTFYSGREDIGKGRSAIFIDLAKTAERAKIDNNLAYVPSAAGFTMIKNQSATAVFCNGGDKCNPQTSKTNPFNGANPASAPAFMLRTDAPVVGLGVPVKGDLFDIGLRCRGEKVDPGAWWATPGKCPMDIEAAAVAPPATGQAAP